MNTQTLSNILWSISPYGFAIYGSVENENDYNSNVVYEDSSKKPTWAQVEGGKDSEQWVQVRGLRDSKLLSCEWTVLAVLRF